MYQKYFKRVIDFFLSLCAILVLSPVLFVLSLVGTFAMGGNPYFVQPRPGKVDKNGKERIFNLIKFRTMNNKKDKDGNLLPDDVRLTPYGRFLRSTSLDELMELFNILKGDMAVIGPRPQLVRDMVFMTEKQRKRHTVRPGLSGLAQISGRNGITWEDKIDKDLEYIQNITFWGDIKIIFLTVWKAFVKREGITQEGMDTAEDLGDYLLRKNEISIEYYKQQIESSKELIGIK